MLLSALVLLLTLPLPARATMDKIIAIENDWPPYYFGTKVTTLPGFAREIIEFCAPATGSEVTFSFFPVKRMYAYLKEGKIDLAIFSRKREREKFVHYAQEPIFSSGYRPVVRHDSAITITTLSDFDTLRLGHLAGLKYSPAFLSYLNARKSDETVITTTSGGHTLRMLLENIIDIYVDTRETVLWRAQEYGVSDAIKILDYDIKSSDYFITIAKNSPRITTPKKLLSLFDTCLKEMREDGNYARIAAKYGIDKQ